MHFWKSDWQKCMPPVERAEFLELSSGEVEGEIFTPVEGLALNSGLMGGGES